MKHTLQEWADFTRCYVVMDPNGIFRLHASKPELRDGYWDSFGMEYLLPGDFVTYFGDWRNSLTAPSELPFKKGELVMYVPRNELARWIVDIDESHYSECRHLTAEEWRTLRGEE